MTVPTRSPIARRLIRKRTGCRHRRRLTQSSLVDFNTPYDSVAFDPFRETVQPMRPASREPQGRCRIEDVAVHRPVLGRLITSGLLTNVHAVSAAQKRWTRRRNASGARRMVVATDSPGDARLTAVTIGLLPLRERRQLRQLLLLRLQLLQDHLDPLVQLLVARRRTPSPGRCPTTMSGSTP